MVVGLILINFTGWIFIAVWNNKKPFYLLIMFKSNIPV